MSIINNYIWQDLFVFVCFPIQFMGIAGECGTFLQGGGVVYHNVCTQWRDLRIFDATAIVFEGRPGWSMY
jgi:hypothetical protein